MRTVVCTSCGMTNMGEQLQCLGCQTPLPVAGQVAQPQAAPSEATQTAAVSTLAAPAVSATAPAPAQPASAAPVAATPPPADPPSPWQPTHRVPAGGLYAYPRPDPQAAPSATLSPWLEVEVVGTVGDWARIVCSNGWTAWVDARPLVR